MKHNIFILVFVAMGFTCIAQSEKDVKTTSASLGSIIEQMEARNNKLEAEIISAKALYDKLNNRKYTPKSTDKEINKLVEFLKGFNSLTEMFDTDQGGWVYRTISEYSESDLRNAYLLILEMNKSLNEPFEEISNKEFIKEASNIPTIMENYGEIWGNRSKDFKQLVKHIKDYEFYMFELARLFEAAKDDGFKTNASVLVERKDAKYLMEVPYTKGMLEDFINNRGVLTPKQIGELQKSCPAAFSDLK